MDSSSENEKLKAKHLSLDVLNAAEFKIRATRGKRVLVVAFLALWSKPCLWQISNLEDIRNRYNDSVDFIFIDADASLELGICYDVQWIPTTLYFFGAQLCARHVGLTSQEKISQELGRLRHPFSQDAETPR